MMYGVGVDAGSEHRETADVPRISQALRIEREGRITQGELARRLGVPQNYVSRWETGARPIKLDDLERIEAAVEIPKGTILRRAGYVDDPTDARTMIAGDPRLNPPERSAVLLAYDGAVAATAAITAKRARN